MGNEIFPASIKIVLKIFNKRGINFLIMKKEKRSSIRKEKDKSSTAGFVTYFRACSNKERNKWLKGPDSLAKKFHVGSAGRMLKLSPILLPIMKKMVPGHYGFVIARTFYFDALFKNALEQGYDQIIIMGAGFDSRAYRFTSNVGKTTVFEIDEPHAQEIKRSVLDQGQIKVPDHVHFVPVDFNVDDLGEKLRSGGYEDGKRNLFIWEGVTEYLTVEGVDATLDFLRHSSAPGSEVAFTYIFKEMLEGDFHYYGSKQIFKMVSKVGEPYSFGIPEGKIASFLKERGFSLVENVSAKDMESKYFTDDSGRCHARVCEHQCIAHAIMANENRK